MQIFDVGPLISGLNGGTPDLAMAITVKDHEGKVTTTHTGCVVSVQTRDYRAMSDVYCDATYATVWDPEKREVREVFVKAHFELDHTKIIECAVDAPIDVFQAIAKAFRAGLLKKSAGLSSCPRRFRPASNNLPRRDPRRKL